MEVAIAPTSWESFSIKAFFSSELTVMCLNEDSLEMLFLGPMGITFLESSPRASMESEIPLLPYLFLRVAMGILANSPMRFISSKWRDFAVTGPIPGRFSIGRLERKSSVCSGLITTIHLGFSIELAIFATLIDEATPMLEGTPTTDSILSLKI